MLSINNRNPQKMTVGVTSPDTATPMISSVMPAYMQQQQSKHEIRFASVVFLRDVRFFFLSFKDVRIFVLIVMFFFLSKM
jgi:hypothetical protein